MIHAIESIEKIEKEYDGHYVLIDHCEYGKFGEVVRGRVAYYEKDKVTFDKHIKSIRIDTDYCTLALTDNGKGLNTLV